MSVTNVTVDGKHMFDPGEVTRTLVISDYGIGVRTVGVGAGSDPTFNQVMGTATFHYLNQVMQTYIAGGGAVSPFGY